MYDVNVTQPLYGFTPPRPNQATSNQPPTPPYPALAAAPRMPGAVRTAAILALVLGVLNCALGAALWLHRMNYAAPGTVAAVALLNLAVGIVYVVGSPLVLTGRTSVVLTVGAIGVLVASLISLAVSHSAGSSLGLFTALFAIKTLRSPAAVGYFAARRQQRMTAGHR